MSSWGRAAHIWRSFMRTPRVLVGARLAPSRRAVGTAAGVLAASLAVGTGLVFPFPPRSGPSRTPQLPGVVFAEEPQEAAAGRAQLSARRMRFNQFASIAYQQDVYMTPRDFLFSVMLENVDPTVVPTMQGKLRKKELKKEEVDQMLETAAKARAGNNLFRNIGDNGLISYTEYLFLLTIITKPGTGFHIAFKMLDDDGNEQVDRKEFLKLKNIIRKRKDKVPKEGDEKPAADVEDVNTTLQALFFGRRGQSKLQYQGFRRFMVDLQAEVHEMEFLLFSKGMDTMRREDFAAWLLHYTNEDDNDAYWENMRKRIPAGQSITFAEFKAFCLFSNNLEDFAFTMKLISEANRPVGMAQFKRAVKIATGHDLSDNVLDTVFKIFDLDGDNCLSHKEFLGVMRDRMLRGLKVQPQYGLSGYWTCVKRETLKGAQEALRDSGSPF